MGYDIKAEREEKERQAKRTAARQARIDRMNSMKGKLLIFGVIEKAKELFVNLTEKISQEYAKEREISKSPLCRCKDCGREISKKAESCPGCGAPIQRRKNFGCSGCFSLLILFFVIITAIGSIYLSLNREKKQSVVFENKKEIAHPKPVPVEEKTISPSVQDSIVPAPEQENKPVQIASPPLLESEEKFREYSQIICHEEWSKRGELDHGMYNYCISTQREEYVKLHNIHKQYAEQYFYINFSYPHCMQSYTKRGISNARMIAYCLEQEIDGMKDYIYYREKYGDEKIRMIANDALEKYHSLRMVSYTIKRYLEE